MLGNVGIVGKHPGILTVLVLTWTLDWNSILVATDDVSRVQQKKSSDKYAY